MGGGSSLTFQASTADMAIRVIQWGTVSCDRCKAELASIRASRDVFEVLQEDGERFATVRCVACNLEDPLEEA